MSRRTVPHARKPALAIGVCRPAETPAGIGAAAVVLPGRLETSLPLTPSDGDVLSVTGLDSAVLLAGDETTDDEPPVDKHWALLKVFVNVHETCAPAGIV
jgi:hypothetical protein